MSNDSLNTFVDSWAEFDARHPEQAHKAVGGMAWGFLRALFECPNCPGVFRTPRHADGTVGTLKDLGPYLVCQSCGGVWQWVRETSRTTSGLSRFRA